MNGERLMDLVQDLTPVIERHAAATELGKRVPDETVQALRSAELFNVWIPESLGGWQLSPSDGCRAMEAMAKVDSAAAWMFQMCNAVSLLCAWFDDDGIGEIFNNSIPMFGDSFAPPMSLHRRDGGFMLNGRSAFVSNCQAIDRFIGLGMAHDTDGTVSLDEHGHPQAYVFSVNREQFEVVDNWNTVGMRGTGSHDVAITDVPLSLHLSASFHPIVVANNSAYRVPIGPLAIWVGATSMSALVLGVVGAAYDDFIALCRNKTPSYFENKLGEGALTQYRLGEVHAHFNAARSYLYGTLDRVWHEISDGAQVNATHKRDLAAAATFTMQTAGHIMELIAASAGTSMIRDESPLSRKSRDLITLRQHVYTASNRYQDIGALCLGLPPSFDLLEF